MRNLKSFVLLLMVTLCLFPCDLSAQKQKRKSDKEKTVSSFIDIYGAGGYSALLHNIDGATVPGGGTGMLGFGYFMKTKVNVNLRAGLELQYLNSSTLMDALNYTGDYFYSDSKIGSPIHMKYNLGFADIREAHNRFSLNIPVMIGYENGVAYFLVGAKFGIPVMGNYSTKTDMTAYLYDPTLVDNLENLPNHGLQTYDVRSKGALKFGTDIMVSAELGMCLDQWMPTSAKEYGGGANKKALSYRFGLFLDYGVMNVNKNNTTQHWINANNMTVEGENVIIPEAEIRNIQPRGFFDTKFATNKSVNPLVVGAKFSILLGVDGAPKEVKRKPLAYPKIRDVVYVKTPTYLYLYVHDAETGAPLDAAVKVFDIDDEKNIIFAGMTDKEKGFVEEQIDNGTYGLSISRPGYIDHNDTLFSVINDTLHVNLLPIKENTVIVLRNLLFDTDKTKIRNISAPSLEELYQLLLNNPTMRIRITGHTDNVGSERYNKRLSEGRAKAVYTEMVKRGIDPSRMEWEGRGSKETLESNDTAEGREVNRRVEFTILSE